MRHLFTMLAAFCLLHGSVVADEKKSAKAKSAEVKPSVLTVVIMDPLAAPLACDCVQGYAQRKYEKLGSFLKKQLGRPVKVVWAEALETALNEKTAGKADLIIGKHSVVLSDAKLAKIKVHEIARLTGKDGKTTQTGLIVVRANDKAKKVRDLKGYRIFFGPANCDEKSAAPMALLKEHGVKLPRKPETYSACSTAATALVELDKNINAAAVISSYAEPLLAGCGAIKKGDLRVVGVTKEIPFVSAFVNQTMPRDDIRSIERAMLAVGEDFRLLLALETGVGFVRPPKPKAKSNSGQKSPKSAKPTGDKTKKSIAKKK